MKYTKINEDTLEKEEVIKTRVSIQDLILEKKFHEQKLEEINGILEESEAQGIDVKSIAANGNLLETISGDTQEASFH